MGGIWIERGRNRKKRERGARGSVRVPARDRRTRAIAYKGYKGGKSGLGVLFTMNNPMPKPRTYMYISWYIKLWHDRVEERNVIEAGASRLNQSSLGARFFWVGLISV